MTTAYFDASALVKLALAEDESEALRRYIGTREVSAVSCELVSVEMTRAVRRGAPRAAPVARAIIDDLRLISITGAVLDLAGRLDPPELRTIDAIHLAVASTLGRELDAMVTYDRRLRRAAETMGLRVEAPA